MSTNRKLGLTCICLLVLIAGCGVAAQAPTGLPKADTQIPSTATAAPPAPSQTAEPTIAPTLSPEPTRRQARYEEEVVAWLQQNGVALDSTEPGTGCDDLQPLLDMIGDARIVALGEATHATGEFFTVKHRIVQCLVQEKGFNLFGLEATWPEGLLINEYVKTGTGDPVVLLSRLYMWWWNSQEVLDLIEWMRAHNANPGDAPVIQFYGLDIQYPRLAIDNVIAYLEQVDPESIGEIESLYACYRPYQGEGSSKGEVYESKTDYWYLSDEEKTACRENLQAVYDHLLSRQAQYEALSSAEAFAMALRNARLVQQAEQRYANVEPYCGHGHYRDLYMAENAAWLLDHGGAEAKIIVWASNRHVEEREGSLGGYLREVYGDEMVIVGFDCFSGSFHAKPRPRTIEESWVAPIVQELATPAHGSFEDYFRQAGMPQFYVDLRTLEPESPAAMVLGGPLLLCARAGTDYDPNAQNCEVKDVAQEYDIMIYIDETSPSTLLPMLPVWPGQGAEP